MFQQVKAHWAKVAAAVAFLAALFTVIVRFDTIRSWVFPKSEVIQFGTVLYGFRDSQFQWPQSYSTADQSIKTFFEHSEGYAILTVQNTSQIDLINLKLLLPTDCMIEVAKNGGKPTSFGPKDTFTLGNLSKGEVLSISTWFDRSFKQGDVITFSNLHGSYSWLPTTFLNLNEYQDLINSASRYQLSTSLLIVSNIATLLFIGYQRFRKQRPVKRPSNQRKKVSEGPTGSINASQEPKKN